MYYPKPLRKAAAAELTLRLKDLPNDLLEDCDNMRLSGGGVVPLGQFKKVTFSSKAVKPVHVSGDKAYVVAQDGLYEVASSAKCVIAQPLDDGCCANYAQKLLFSCKEGLFDLTDNAQRLHIKGYNSLVAVGDRLLGADDSGLTVNKVDDCSDWSQSVNVYPYVACDCLVADRTQAVALGDVCYVYKVRAEELQSVFRPIAYNVGKVCKDSVATLPHMTVFTSDSGVYCYRKDAVRKLFDNLDGTLRFDMAAGCPFDGMYLVSCRRTSSKTNDVTLLLDPDRQKVVGVLNTGYSAMCSDGQTVYAVRNNELYLLGSGQGNCSLTVTADMGTAATKFLTGLTVLTQNSLTVWIESDGQRNEYRFSSSKQLQSRPIVGYGKLFRVELSAAALPKLLQVTARTTKGVKS